MELLVYVRNRGGFGGAGTIMGASAGSSPSIADPRPSAELTSLAEFRVDGSLRDPVAELREAIADVFAVLAADLRHRTLYWTRPRSGLKVCLEPGFDARHVVESTLAELLHVIHPGPHGEPARRGAKQVRRARLPQPTL